MTRGSMTKTVILIDGENISTRYSEMLKAGYIAREDNISYGDYFVWNPSILADNMWDILRISYHTSMAGDDLKIEDAKQSIASVNFKCRAEVKGLYENKQLFRSSSGRIVPQVRKRASKSRKESICDIAIAVEALRACYRDHASKIWILSGDGDFISLYQEIMHGGKEVVVAALSSGLNASVPVAVDHFIDLDPYLFRAGPNKSFKPTPLRGAA